MLNSLLAQEQTQPVVEGVLQLPLAAAVFTSFGVLIAGLLAFVATWLGHRQTEKHFRLSNHRDRFTTIASQLADPSAAVRIAGVYAMEALADDWLQYLWYTSPKKKTNARHEAQTCINVLCSYLCLPYEPSGREQTHTKTVIRYEQPSNRVVEEHHEHRTEDSQVRQGILRIMAAHLRPDARTSWSGFNFDFTGAYLENTDFADCVFHGSAVFTRARFHGERTSFGEAQFRGEDTSFTGAQFHGEDTSFDEAQFRSKHTWFDEAQFRSKHTLFGEAQFRGLLTSFATAQFSSEHTSFTGAQFRGEQTSFTRAQFHGARTRFTGAQFHGTQTRFTGAQFRSKQTVFGGAQFRSKQTSFAMAQFHGGSTSFEGVQFRSGRTSFDGAQFSSEQTSFDEAQFRGPVDFSGSEVRGNVVVDWQSPFPSEDEAPAPVRPANVLPVDWPPVVASPSATMDAP